MLQIPRFTGVKNPAVPKTSTGLDTSALALQSLLKRAEDRKRAQDESRGEYKKRPAEFEGNVKDKFIKRKKFPVAHVRDETTAERDSRKASAKEDKRLRKDLERGNKSTGQILLKKTDIHEAVRSPVKSDEVPQSTEESDHSNEAVELELPEGNAPPTSSIAEQLHPSKKVRDESQKVLSQKRMDDDEDFVGDDENDESLSEHPKPMTVLESIHLWNLDSLIAANLAEDGIENFFPVQRMVIPQLLRNNARLCVQPRDMCVSAPTGSGKTIAYAVPILQSLKFRSIVRLRALLLLPSRELATQVYSVFCRLSRGTELAIAVCTGQTPLEDEQRLIMGACYNGFKGGRHGAYSSIDSDSLFSNRNLYFDSPTSLGTSAVDILICTPGRLLDHIQYTEGFTLQHLRFLVLDEADRLLGNAYHSWVRSLVQSAHDTEATSVGGLSNTRVPAQQSSPSTISNKCNDCFGEENLASGLDLCLPFLALPQQPLQRLLFSATLTDNPRKLTMLGIKNPFIVRATSSDVLTASHANMEGLLGKLPESNLNDSKVKSSDSTVLVSAAGGYMLPHTLEESITICETARRPLVLLSMLLEAMGIPMQYVDPNPKAQKADKGHSILSDICNERGSMCLVFSSSVETTHRLCRLLQLFNSSYERKDGDRTDTTRYLFGGRVAEMSRLMRSEEREVIMKEAAAGEIKILVSSDHMARGIDLANIKLVVNYDPPKYAKMYVHRVGRTARANRVGCSVTLLKAGQVGAFKKMRASIGSSGSTDGLTKFRSDVELEQKIDLKYNAALKQLSGVIERETKGDLAVGEEI